MPAGSVSTIATVLAGTVARALTSVTPSGTSNGTVSGSPTGLKKADTGNEPASTRSASERNGANWFTIRCEPTGWPRTDATAAWALT